MPQGATPDGRHRRDRARLRRHRSQLHPALAKAVRACRSRSAADRSRGRRHREVDTPGAKSTPRASTPSRQSIRDRAAVAGSCQLGIQTAREYLLRQRWAVIGRVWLVTDQNEVAEIAEPPQRLSSRQAGQRRRYGSVEQRTDPPSQLPFTRSRPARQVGCRTRR